MIPVEQQQDPRNDIGPIYKYIAGIALLLAVGVGVLHAWKGNPVQLYDVIWLGLIVLLVVCLWRPEKFDMIIKAIADHLPNLSFVKREVSSVETAEHVAQTSGEGNGG